MINDLMRESKNSFSKSALDSYSLKELMDLYITYVRPKYFKEHDNMQDILEYISSYIIRNLSDNAFLDNLDLYTKLMIEVINLEDMIKSTDNIISIREDNLQDDFFFEMQSKTFKMNKYTYKNKYIQELNNIKGFNVLYKQILKLLDKFQDNILSILNSNVNNISSEEKKILLVDINKKIDDNSLEILKRIELRRDRKKLELHSRFKDISVNELLNSLDITYLKEQNYVYTNFQGMLKEIKKNK